MSQMQIAALFVRRDSVYKTLPGVDCWDIDRDARLWPGGCPVVAHPPCRAWGQMSHLSNPRPDEMDLARFAVAQVRRFSGVLEHPNRSKLWHDQGLPMPGKTDEFGGWTLAVSQKWWGHRAEKLTLLYIVGCNPFHIPDIPYSLAESSHVIAQSNRNQKLRARPECGKKEREHTPPELAEWLIELARRCKK